MLRLIASPSQMASTTITWGVCHDQGQSRSRASQVWKYFLQQPFWTYLGTGLISINYVNNWSPDHKFPSHDWLRSHINSLLLQGLFGFVYICTDCWPILLTLLINDHELLHVLANESYRTCDHSLRSLLCSWWLRIWIYRMLQSHDGASKSFARTWMWFAVRCTWHTLNSKSSNPHARCNSEEGSPSLPVHMRALLRKRIVVPLSTFKSYGLRENGHCEKSARHCSWHPRQSQAVCVMSKVRTSQVWRYFLQRHCRLRSWHFLHVVILCVTGSLIGSFHIMVD